MVSSSAMLMIIMKICKYLMTMIKITTTMTVAILMTTPMMLIMMPRWANVFLFFSVLFTLFLASNVIVLKVQITA